MADDAGKGFAVVAEEIRNLSQGCNNSAKQIAKIVDELIHNSNISVSQMKDVENGTDTQMKKLQEKEETFSSLKNKIQSVSEVTANIKVKSDELGVLRDQVNTGIDQLKEFA